jgi:hypothetical protein
VAISGQLHSVPQARSKIADKLRSGSQIALANHPARDQFCISVDGRPSPDVSGSFRHLLFLDFLLLGVHERPDFIALDPAARQIAKVVVLVLLTDGPKVKQ